MKGQSIFMEDIYTDSFYASMKDKENGCRRAAEYVFGLIRPASVVDIGCGTGAWLGLFKACGAQVHGYDGDYVNRDMLVIEQEEFTPYDLSEKIPVDRRYDMAMSLEVAEHLDAGCADRFVADLTQFSDVVLFSAAIPGQGGDGWDIPDLLRPRTNVAPPPAGGQNPPAAGSEVITFAPVFNFYGPTTREEAVEAGRLSFAEFKRLYDQLKAEERRKQLHYALGG